MTTADSPSRFVITQPLARQEPKPPRERALPLEQRRLQAALAVAGSRLAALETSQREAPPWVVSARALYECAQSEVRAGDLDGSWRFLHEVRRELVSAMDSAEVGSTLITLGQEAETKLVGWRREAVRALLAALSSASSLEEQREALRAAMAVRDEHCDNVYYRHRQLGRGVSMSSATLVCLGAAFLTLLLTQKAVLPLPGGALTWQPLAAGMLLGGMGAAFSALIGFASTPAQHGIPAQLTSGLVTFMRPLVGAVSGLVAVLLVHAGLVNFGAVSLVVPFAFGFSERLLARVAERSGA